MRTGSIIDFYDDPAGDVLQQKVPGDLPDFIKTASCLTDQQRDRLPDDVFALVMLDQGEPIRKYACVDKGNTALSVIYFLENHHKLPEEAQKTAAINLLTACGWYDMEPPRPLMKIAGLGGALTLAMAPGQMKGAIQKGAQRHQQMMEGVPKVGELSGTHVMPKDSDRPEDEEKTASSDMDGAIRAILMAAPVAGGLTGAGAGALAAGEGRRGQGALRGGLAGAAGGLGGLVGSAQIDALHGMPVLLSAPVTGALAGGLAGLTARRRAQTAPEESERTASLHPHVDITGQRPPERFEKVASQRTLLNGRFPVDSYGEVEQARQWFEDYGETLHPIERREYCTKLASRAAELSINLTPKIEKYAGVGYAPDGEIKVAVHTRMQLWAEDSPERDMLKGLLEKRASVRPEVFCEALRQFDELTGTQHYWDTGIYDPWYSTFGKTAGAGWTFEHMGDRVDEEMLKRVSVKDRNLIKKKFGCEFAEEFQKKPREIFDSLPLDTKRIIMRMANDPQP